MTKEEALQKPKEISTSNDTEEAHAEADGVLCELLTSLGCGEVAKAFEKIGKWYS